MPMAADQRRKRLNGASIADGSSWEQNRMKKKKLESSESEFQSKSHISLEWDGQQKRVVAKKEQIAMSWRNLRPFIESVPHSCSILADVFTIPREVFKLDNLTEVLSYEVWQTLLSENERNYLVRFLPKGQDAEQVVQALLCGENFHFGNPVLEWGASLCSGDLHPDAVRRHEEGLKADKKVYYSEIQNYHHDMIKYLQKLKERWEGSKDPEQEIVQKISSRPRKEMEKKISKNAKKSRVCEVEQDVRATSESSSGIADDKACSSDNLNSSMMKGGDLQKRMGESCSVKEKGRNLMTASDNVLNMGGKPKTIAKLQRSNVNFNDGSKYMSYIKVTKTQYEHVKTMKQSCKSIQLRSLNHVLGNLDSLHVQPYEVFLKEEQKRLHEHWLKLANEDLPVAYANWRARQTQKLEMIKSLEQDMKDQLNLVESMERENPDMLQDYGCESETHSDSNTGDEGEADAQNEEKENLLQDHKFDSETKSESDMETEADTEDDEEADAQNEEKGNPENVLQNQKAESERKSQFDTEDDEEDETQIEEKETPENMLHHHKGNSVANFESPQIQSLQHISSLNGSLEFDRMDVESDKNHATSKLDGASSDLSESSGNSNTADVSVSHRAPHSSAGDVWTTVGIPHSYHETTASHEYTSASGLSHMHPLASGKQCSPLINLESDLHEVDPGKNMISRQADDGSFNSYTNQDRNELLQSFFKDQGVLSYNHEQKQPDLDFQQANNVLMEDGHFPGHFQEPPLAMEQGQKRQCDIFMPQNILDNIYSGEGRYLISRQEHFAPSNVQEWNTNPVHMSSTLQPHLNGGELLSQNWFPGEHQLRGGWNGSDIVNVPGQAMVSGNNADQSLYSVLSQCNQLRPVGTYDSVGSTEQFVSSRSYGMVGGAHGISSNLAQARMSNNLPQARISSNLPQATSPLDYLGGRDPATSLMPDDMGWANLQHQNPAVHDPMGKPYLRSWNQ